jgi:hypothetical protein
MLAIGSGFRVHVTRAAIIIPSPLHLSLCHVGAFFRLVCRSTVKNNNTYSNFTSLVAVVTVLTSALVN